MATGRYFEEMVTVREGAMLFSSDGAYIGRVRDRVVFPPQEPLVNCELMVCGNAIFGGDFPLNGGWVKTLNHGKVDLSCDLMTVLRHASLEFRWPEEANLNAETREHKQATRIIETVNRQTFALIQKVRSVRHEAVKQFGALSPEEEALIKRITDLEMEAIDASVQVALAGIKEMKKEVA